MEKPEPPKVSDTLPTEEDPRWRAVVERDHSFDGVFLFSVATTGVYCRPSCAARRARPENVRFHDTREDAEAAGFRPCKRCRPDRPSLSERNAGTVTRICRMIEAAEEMPSLGELARSAGLSPYHFHRVFKSVTGVTPKAYGDAHRADRLRRELTRAEGSVTEAIFGAGFGSATDRSR